MLRTIDEARLSARDVALRPAGRGRALHKDRDIRYLARTALFNIQEFSPGPDALSPLTTTTRRHRPAVRTRPRGDDRRPAPAPGAPLRPRTITLWYSVNHTEATRAQAERHTAKEVFFTNSYHLDLL
jgi:hypothetical protein